ncbi:MAG: 2-oxo-4-hydroxy-4-carboxy-5-ureidoimidazoline decarboxylase [Pseudomonadota bacterium]
MKIETLNKATTDGFVQSLDFLYEHSPWVVQSAAKYRPFADGDALLSGLQQAVADAGESQQRDLLNAHPDLAGKAAIRGELTDCSTREQASAGLDQLSPEEHTQFVHFNEAYREQFGFPFIICVREHDKHSILSEMARRMKNTSAVELAAGLEEVRKIVRYRWKEVADDQPD